MNLTDEKTYLVMLLSASGHPERWLKIDRHSSENLTLGETVIYDGQTLWHEGGLSEPSNCYDCNAGLTVESARNPERKYTVAGEDFMGRYPDRWQPRWGGMQNVYPEEPERNEHKSPSVFEIISRLLLPVAVIIAGLFRKANVYLLVLFVALALIVTFFHSLKTFARSMLDKAHDRRIALKNIKQLQRFSKEAKGYFDFSPSSSDSIPAIVQEITNRNYALGSSIQFAAVGIFNEHWHFLNRRIQQGKFDSAKFHETVCEFTSLLQCYNTFCITPVFQKFTSEQLKDALSVNEKGKLNAFQQRYVAFVSAYSKYITEVGEEFRTLPNLYAGMSLPAPL